MQNNKPKALTPTRATLWIFLGVMAMSGGQSVIEVQAQTNGIACNPGIRGDNPSCTEEAKCLRIRGNCGLLNWLCVDGDGRDAASRRGSTFVPNGVCNAVCTGAVGRCESGTVPCNADLDCQARERCQQGVCVFQSGSCVRDGDCQPGQTCQIQPNSREGVCAGQPSPAATSPAAECTRSDQCGPGKLCLEGVCRPKASIQPCQRSRDCGASDEVCYQGRCLKF
jgi:hypothetical protein